LITYVYQFFSGIWQWKTNVTATFAEVIMIKSQVHCFYTPWNDIASV